MTDGDVKDSCDAGYYCAAGPAVGKTLCCAQGQSLAQCADTNGVSAASYSSELPKPTIAAYTVSSAPPVSAYSYAANTSSIYTKGYPTPASYSASATYPAVGASSGLPPTASPSKVPLSGGRTLAPAGAALALAGAVLAAFL